VRVRAPALGPVIQSGKLTLVTRDSIRMVPDGDDDERTIPVESIQRLDLSVAQVSRGRRVLWGLGVGVGLGALAGLSGAMADTCLGGEDDPIRLGDDDERCHPNEDKALEWAAIGAGAGGIIGLFVGLARPRDEWRRMPLDGVALGASVRSGASASGSRLQCTLGVYLHPALGGARARRRGR
jgi:hypothetical protein